MAGPLAGGGTGAVVPGGQVGATAASAVPRPSSGAAETAAATSPVDVIRFRRVRSWRLAGAPGSDVDEAIRIAFLGLMRGWLGSGGARGDLDGKPARCHPGQHRDAVRIAVDGDHAADHLEPAADLAEPEHVFGYERD